MVGVATPDVSHTVSRSAIDTTVKSGSQGEIGDLLLILTSHQVLLNPRLGPSGKKHFGMCSMNLELCPGWRSILQNNVVIQMQYGSHRTRDVFVSTIPFGQASATWYRCKVQIAPSSTLSANVFFCCYIFLRLCHGLTARFGVCISLFRYKSWATLPL